MRNARWLVGSYTYLLRLMPAAHRERFRDDMVEVLDRMIEKERPAGSFARIRWDLSVLLRGAVAVASMHLDLRRTRRSSRASWSGGSAGSAGGSQDLRYVVRSLGSAPWYTATVIGVVAVPLTMAATTFAIVDGVLFRPLPYPNAAELVALKPNFNGPARVDPAATQAVSELDLRHWRAALPEIPLTAYRAQPWSGLGGGINDNAAGVALVEPNFFDVIGVKPMVGGFSPDDFHTPAKMRPVIATYDVWRGRFAGADILGLEIVGDRASGSGFRVVGIMPRGFTFPSARSDVSFISPYVSTTAARENPQARALTEIVARLPRGARRAELEQRLRQAAAIVAAEFPANRSRPAGWSDLVWHRQGPYEVVDTMPLSETLSLNYGGFFRAVFGAVSLLLLMAAVNISSLMSARALDRRSEMDVRRSLGAGRAAIARLWGIESLVLVLGGGVLAACSTPTLLHIMKGLLPDTVVLLKPATLDWRVAGFMLVTLFSLAMAVTIAPIRRSLTSASGRRVTSRVRTRSRFLIISGQVSVAVVLTVLGSMLVGSLLVVYAERPGLQMDGVVVLDVMLSGPGATMQLSPERAAREQTIRAGLLKLPGVLAAGSSAAQVLKGGGAMTWFTPPPGRTHPKNVDTWAVSEGFYTAVGPEVIAGRVQNDDELRSAAPLVVVSESVARRFWPDRPALGQTLTDGGSKAAFTVIGVVRDIRWTALDVASPVIYAPYGTTSRAPWITLFIRTDGHTGRVTTEALKAIERIDPLARPTRLGTLDELFRDSVSLRRFQSWLFGSFAAASLVIVGGGILGLLAMTTARRTKEVGIRCALGATPRRVVGLVLREQLHAVLAGLLVGAAGAALAVRPLETYLYEITPADPRVWAAAIGLVLVMAAFGTLLPALRASRTDPLQALRQE